MHKSYKNKRFKKTGFTDHSNVFLETQYSVQNRGVLPRVQTLHECELQSFCSRYSIHPYKSLQCSKHSAHDIILVSLCEFILLRWVSFRYWSFCVSPVVLEVVKIFALISSSIFLGFNTFHLHAFQIPGPAVAKIHSVFFVLKLYYWVAHLPPQHKKAKTWAHIDGTQSHKVNLSLFVILLTDRTINQLRDGFDHKNRYTFLSVILIFIIVVRYFLMRKVSHKIARFSSKAVVVQLPRSL